MSTTVFIDLKAAKINSREVKLMDEMEKEMVREERKFELNEFKMKRQAQRERKRKEKPTKLKEREWKRR